MVVYGGYYWLVGFVGCGVVEVKEFDGVFGEVGVWVFVY